MLVIPGILTANSSLIEKLGPLGLPALQRLLAKGRREASSWRGVDQWLFEKFDLQRQTDWPSAPFALLAEGTSPGDFCWVHADPVSLRADRDRLLLADAALLKIHADEAQAIAATFRNYFGDAMELHIASPARWYARLAAPPEGETTPLAVVAGRSIEPGRGAMGWHALMNEMQMLLHEHPVNEARELRGELPINGVWLWGAGGLAPVESPFHSVAASLPLARGLALHAGIAAFSLPGNAAQWINQLSAEGLHVCVPDAAEDPASNGSEQGFLDMLTRLERDWFAPLYSALEDGRIDMLTLSLGGPRTLVSVETIRQDLRRFWRRPKSLAITLALAAGDEDEAP